MTEKTRICAGDYGSTRDSIHLIWRFTTRFELGLFSRKVNDFHPSTFLYPSISIIYLVIRLLQNSNHKKTYHGEQPTFKI